MTNQFCATSLSAWHLASADDGASFEANQISPADPEIGCWSVSLSKAGPYHPVEDPVILYQYGPNNRRSDEGQRTTTENDIMCVFMSERD